MSIQTVKVTVNGRQYAMDISSGRSLLEFLREDLGLTGTKKGCDRGDCGACTVLLDGLPINSCLLLAVQANGKDITTIEGIAEAGELTPLQKAFVRNGAVQCGFCTPGLILISTALLRENPNPSREEIQKAISGNLCRCTGYVQIIEAIEAAAKCYKKDR